MKYKSPDVRNELIGLMAADVTRRLLADISKARYYCIMVDETSDTANREQLCFVLRYELIDRGRFSCHMSWLATGQSLTLINGNPIPLF